MAETIRPSVAADVAGLEKLYAAAFPDEDLIPLLRELLALPGGVLSLVALSGDDEIPIGHVAFTICGIEGGTDKVSMLAPLAVAPARQKQGIGSRLVREGFRRVEADGVSRFLVLGDPAYYGRFGFVADDAVVPPYPLPAEWRRAWQARAPRGAVPVRGRLAPPRPWLRPALWAA